MDTGQGRPRAKPGQAEKLGLNRPFLVVVMHELFLSCKNILRNTYKFYL